MRLLFLVAAVLVVVKTTVLEAFRIAGVLPDLFLVLVVYVSLFRGPKGGLAVGALVGFLIALASPVGASASYPVVYGVGGWLAGIAWGPIMRRSFATEFLILLLLGVLIDALLLARDVGLSRALLLSIPVLVIPSALATALVGPFLFAGAARLLETLRLGALLRVRERR